MSIAKHLKTDIYFCKVMLYYSYMEILSCKVITNSNIILEGKHLKKNSDTCIVFVPGLAGAYDGLAKTVTKFCDDNNFGFVWARTQSCFLDTTLNKIITPTETTQIKAGACYDNFNTTINELNAWYNYVKIQNYKNIIFVGHCYGCNKIVYFLNNNKNIKNVKSCIFLAPTDFNNLFTDERHVGLLEEAIANVRNNQKDKILSKKIYGFFTMSSSAFLRIGYNPFLNNIPYKSNNGDFSMLNNINCPIYAIIGSNDKGLGKECSLEDVNALMAKITDNCQHGKYLIITGARHSFRDDYDKVYNVLVKIFKTNVNTEEKDNGICY